MIELAGDLLAVHASGGTVVIPTNLTCKRNGDLVMGRGLAKAFAERDPTLPRFFGMFVRQNGGAILADWQRRVIMFPTKHHWRDTTADESLIADSADSLMALCGSRGAPAGTNIYLPRVGCGEGRLDWATQVRPLLAKILTEPRFIVITPP